jgi:hypothetical protein
LIPRPFPLPSEGEDEGGGYFLIFSPPRVVKIAEVHPWNAFSDERGDWIKGDNFAKSIIRKIYLKGGLTAGS